MQKTLSAQTTSPPPIIWSKCFGGSLNDGNDNQQISPPSLLLIETKDSGYAICARTSSIDGDISGYHGGITDVYFAKLDSIGNVQFSYTLGGNGSDAVIEIMETHDSGFLIIGNTTSRNGNANNYHGNGDIWITKIDSLGNLAWSNCFGGSNYEFVFSKKEGGFIKEFSDGTIILFGCTNSDDGDINGYHAPTLPFNFPGYDLVILKIDFSGNVIWTRCIGGGNGEDGGWFLKDINNSLSFVGLTSSTDGDFSANISLNQPVGFCITLDTSGLILSNNIYQNNLFENASSTVNSIDKGILSIKMEIDTNFLPDLSKNIILYNIDSSGVISWFSSLLGSGNDIGSIYQSRTGDIYVYGYTTSIDGDFTTNHGQYDLFVSKFNKYGSKLWTNCYGGNLDDGYDSIAKLGPLLIAEDLSGNLIVTSRTKSNNGNVFGLHGDWDNWAFQIDTMGTLLWQITIGGSNTENVINQIQTGNGIIYLATTKSVNGNVNGNNGGSDIMIYKLSFNGTLDWIKCIGSSADEFDNYTNLISASNGLIIFTIVTAGGGNTFNYHGGNDLWVVRLGNDPTATSLQEYSNEKGVTIFPNPTKDELNIEVDNSVIGSTYQLTDITGRPIKTGIIKEEKSRISLQGLSSGTYLYSIGNQIRKTLKVVKE